MIMKTIITLAATLIITGCSGISNTRQINTLPDIVQVGQNLLSRDTIEEPDYPTLTREQRLALGKQTKSEVPAGTQLIGERSVGKGLILSVYKIPTGKDPNQFKVYLVTSKGDSTVVDAVDLREFHTSEHQQPLRLGGNRFYTTDSELHFDSPDHIILHRVMTLTSLYLKDHRLTEIWRVEWDNNYNIDTNGHITFHSQQETHRSPSDINDPMIEEYQSRDRQ